MCFCGINPSNGNNNDIVLIMLTAVINFLVWEGKLRKKIPTFNSIRVNLFHILKGIDALSKEFNNVRLFSNLAMCRDWNRWTDGL